MAVADFLKDIGEDIATGAKAAGKAAVPILERTAQVESGQAPQIDAEQRKQQEAAEDAQINIKAQALESQLAMGQKYGTLTPQQQQQYVDQITGLYSHPRHAGTLMEKLRKAIHPNGAYAQGPQSPLPDATPPGGTAAADEATKEREESRKLADALTLVDERAAEAAKYHKPAGKSPPVPGAQLPVDAIGPDGQIIPMAQRTSGQSFMEWNGAWYPAPKAKPIYQVIGGNVMLMDPATGRPQRNLGPKEGVKFATRQTPFLGDDGQMHLLTTTSVTTAQGENIEVEATPADAESGARPQSPSAPSPQPKTPAKKVGNILPKTGAKPAGGGTAGPVIPGSHAWARTKDPLYRANLASYKKANDAVIAATNLSSLADQVAQHPNDAVNQKRFAVALERQAAGRFTEQALKYVISAGWGNTLEQWATNPTTGALPADVMRQLVDGAHQNLAAAQDALKIAQGELGQQEGSSPSASAPATASDPDPDVDAIIQALKKQK